MSGNRKDQNVPGRPVIVFDVNETLLNLDALRPTFDRIFNDPAATRLWFADLIPVGGHLGRMVTEPVCVRAVML